MWHCDDTGLVCVTVKDPRQGGHPARCQGRRRHRNRHPAKTALTDEGSGPLAVTGRSSPTIVPTGGRGLWVTGLSARGLPVRDGRASLWQMHEVPCGGMALFALPPAIGRTIYTTNAVESLNRSLHKAIETRGGFASDAAAATLLYMAIRQAGLR